MKNQLNNVKSPRTRDDVSVLRVSLNAADTADPTRLAHTVRHDYLDFIFHTEHKTMLVALDFEGHDRLAAMFADERSETPGRVLGGRLGLNDQGEIGTSEWSGHFGFAWSSETRHAFRIFLKDLLGYAHHLEWSVGQDKNDVG